MKPASPKTTKPRRLQATLFMSLDGVVQDPAWSFPYWNDEVRAFKAEETEGSDALLLGRKTYEMFAQVWPTSTDEGAPYFNGVRKYVVSRTLKKEIWSNTKFIDSDFRASIRKLKAEAGANVVVHGSVSLVRWLLAENLLDELRLLVYPIVLGKGERLFDGSVDATFELSSSHATSNGVLALVYRPRPKP